VVLNRWLDHIFYVILLLQPMINKLTPTSIQITLHVKCTSHHLDPILNLGLYTLQDSTGAILFQTKKELEIGKSYSINNGLVKMMNGFMVLVSKPERIEEIGDLQVVDGDLRNVSRTEYTRI
jgi:hypothetical protein